MNKPSCLYISGKYACKTKSMIVTNVAMITIYIGILIFEGIIFLNKEINMFDRIVTIITATAIVTEFLRVLEMASTEHRPTNCDNIGLPSTIPSLNIFDIFISHLYFILLNASIA